MGALQVFMGYRLFGLWRNNYVKRILNGQQYFESLGNIKGITLPSWLAGAKTAFNRFPVLVENVEDKRRLLDELSKEGIEASFMYLKPVHMLWDLGYRQGELPNSEYFAEHLLTLPSHGLVNGDDIVRIGSIIGRVLNGDKK